jgi:hypothetical protein
MSQELKFNLYEIQVVLYWILGVLILNIGEWHWVGWISILYGWVVAILTVEMIISQVKKKLAGQN